MNLSGTISVLLKQKTKNNFNFKATACLDAGFLISSNKHNQTFCKPASLLGLMGIHGRSGIGFNGIKV